MSHVHGRELFTILLDTQGRLTSVLWKVNSEVAVRVKNLVPEEIHLVEEKDLLFVEREKSAGKHWHRRTRLVIPSTLAPSPLKLQTKFKLSIEVTFTFEAVDRPSLPPHTHAHAHIHILSELDSPWRSSQRTCCCRWLETDWGILLAGSVRRES